MFTDAEIKRLSEILDKYPDVTVLSDDVYYYLPFDGRKHTSFANYSESNWNKTINVFSSGKMLNCTGWKIGWSIGPENLVKQAMFVHESTSFNTNVPGQIALARSMDQALTQEYKGYENYLDYTRAVFQSGRDAAIDLIGHSKNINFKPTVCESGYFLAVDVTGCEDQIPEKYFKPNVNYENDEATQVNQMHFPEYYDKVPLDFALGRYLAVEKGVSIMPLSNFCMQESKHVI